MRIRILTLVTLFLAGMASAVAQTQPLPPAAPSPEPLRVEVRVVNVFATVKDGDGRLLPNLNGTQFAVLEDGEARDLGYFAREDEVSLLLILLVDTSTSQAQILTRERRIAADFLKRVLKPGDQVALVGFDSNAYILQEPTTDTAKLNAALDRLVPFAPGFQPQLKPSRKPNGSRMCAALSWVSEMEPPQMAHRKVVVLISDGVDAELNTELQPTLENVLRNDVMVYSIRAIDEGHYAWWDAPRLQAADRAMRLVARETGGLFFVGQRAGRLEEAFQQIAEEVRSQYSLGFTPKYLTYTGRFHRITVQVKQGGAKVRARRGYFSPSR
jgi:VWFA-related protein